MIVKERLSVQIQSEDGLIELAHRIARKTGGHITSTIREAMKSLRKRKEGISIVELASARIFFTASPIIGGLTIALGYQIIPKIFFARAEAICCIRY